MADDVKLVRMVRSADRAEGGPTEADVHPDEVQNYQAGGFEVADEAPKARKANKE